MSVFSRASALPLLVAGAMFMENLDGTVIVTAMPQMAASFGVQPVDMNIGITAYILALTVFIPASGWIANRFGARTVFSVAVAIFTLASVLCALSPSLPLFTAARILQGIAGALMVPVGRLIVLRNAAKQDLIKAIATITWPALVAPILGPPVGGFITTYASWHWIFILNVPLGVVALILAGRLIPRETAQQSAPFDIPGFVLTGVACFGLMFGLDLISHPQLSWLVPVLCVGGSLALGLLAVRHAKRSPHPLVELWAMRIKSYAVTIWGGTLFRIAIGAVPFLLPLMFQLAFGLNAFDAGLLVLAVFAGNLAMKPFTSAVLFRFPFRTILVGNGLLNAATIFACALLTPQTPTWLILALLFVSGLTRSMQFTALNTLAFSEVPQPRMNGANTLFNMAQQLGGGLSIAIGALALRLAEMLFPGRSAAVPLADFQLAFVAIGVVALLAVVDSFTLNRDAGSEIRRKKTATPAQRGNASPPLQQK
ncbi:MULTISPECIES: MFS transporter [Serratia]|uniref:High-copy suppressor of rspA n=1 Tax=Serratia ficaria TaxID=61651 RepID=A0A240BZU5_SERFI|nr:MULTISPECIES: MFS transporter [Serratia]REF44858.1 EmrB/QacA subfamily drug resistance transporter [Serratia ficaria]CAI0751218.1 High-copy suppressor of rspA [Serratia ficaria]CAI0784646.1 High-copy suppressor of rspA [Serratia ficaria]CAI0831454.1 High-copy suppressor of rspA [Serratia ficaria]CAI0883148.1 High-copy suppressor of rspA [Serratia ficaria]